MSSQDDYGGELGSRVAKHHQIEAIAPEPQDHIGSEAGRPTGKRPGSLLMRSSGYCTIVHEYPVAEEHETASPKSFSILTC